MGSCALTCVSMQKKSCSISDHLVVTPASSIDIVCFWHFVWSRPDEHCAKTTADGQGWCAGFSLVATCRYVEWHRSQWRNRSNRFDLARNCYYFFIFFSKLIFICGNVWVLFYNHDKFVDGHGSGFDGHCRHLFVTYFLYYAIMACRWADTTRRGARGITILRAIHLGICFSVLAFFCAFLVPSFSAFLLFPAIFLFLISHTVDQP